MTGLPPFRSAVARYVLMLLVAWSAVAATRLPLRFLGAASPTPLAEPHGRVLLRGLYQGVDAVFYRNPQGETEYDFMISPVGDPASIRIAFEATAVSLTPAGDLRIRIGAQEIVHRRPFAYQRIAGVVKPVRSEYRLEPDGEVRFQLGVYDHGVPLVIDPVLTARFQFTAPEGTFTYPDAVATDSAGNTYITGSTTWSGFPATPGPFTQFHGGNNDVFVTKLAPDGKTVVWSVLVGGSGSEGGQAIAVDSQGNVYVAGTTESPDFPSTVPTANGHKAAFQQADAFVFKLNPTGTELLYSIVIGGSGSDTAAGLAVAPDQRVLISGSTTSTDFPVTSNAFQQGHARALLDVLNNRDAIVVRLSPAGQIEYSTYLGGPNDDYATAAAFGPGADIYVAGIAGAYFPTLASAFAPSAEYGGFITRLDHTTGQLVYSTFLPGVSHQYIQQYPTVSLAVDAAGNAYAAGGAEFTFPTTPGAFQTDVDNGSRSAFLLELNPSGSSLVFATLIGGSVDDFALGLALTGNSVTIAGMASSYDFPATDYSMPACNLSSLPYEFHPPFSTFVARFDHTGGLVTASEYSLCSDERVYDIAAGPNGVVLAGSDTASGFIATINLDARNPVQVAYVVDAASLGIGALSPIEIVSIFGSGLGPKLGVPASPTGGRFPTTLAGTQVLFGGTAMPLLYVSESQINAIIPGRAFYMAPINVFTASGTSADLLTQMAASTPAIFTAGQSGVGQGAILNQDGTANSTSNPAVRGSIISIFGTGGGQTTPPFADGQIVPSPASLAADMGAGIGGFPAPVNYAGTAPYLVNGVMQVNVQIPENAPTGGAVPLVLASYLYRSQSGVTVAIK